MFSLPVYNDPMASSSVRYADADCCEPTWHRTVNEAVQSHLIFAWILPSFKDKFIDLGIYLIW